MTLIRPARPEDAGALAQLAETTFRDTFGAQNSAENMAMYCADTFSPEIQRAEINDTQTVTLLAQDSGELVGYAQLHAGAPALSLDAAHPLELKRLYVHSAMHGRGVAHTLMDVILAEAATRAHDCLWLGVWEHNPRAQAFYHKYDFVEAGEHPFWLGQDRQRDVIMTRTLEPR